VERRLHQRKWKWIVHGSPPHQNLTSITPPSLSNDQSSDTSISLFFTTSVGSVYEYQIPKQLGQLSNYAQSILVMHNLISVLFFIYQFQKVVC
jgi:hypothetical protein